MGQLLSGTVIVETLFSRPGIGRLLVQAILAKDYLTVPVDQVGGIESLLTMVGGKVMYASGPFSALEPTRATK